jgi:hypothetical protein
MNGCSKEIIVTDAEGCGCGFISKDYPGKCVNKLKEN